MRSRRGFLQSAMLLSRARRRDWEDSSRQAARKWVYDNKNRCLRLQHKGNVQSCVTGPRNGADRVTLRSHLVNKQPLMSENQQMMSSILCFIAIVCPVMVVVD